MNRKSNWTEKQINDAINAHCNAVTGKNIDWNGISGKDTMIGDRSLASVRMEYLLRGSGSSEKFIAAYLKDM